MGDARPKLPRIITHANYDAVLDKYIRNHPSMQPGGGHLLPQPAWFHEDAILEVPTGELARDGLTTMALVGRSRPEPAALTGDEGFNAQGLEGKVRIRKPLLNALLNLDIIPRHRGRVIVLGGSTGSKRTKRAGGKRRHGSYEGPRFGKGDRVELHPGTDAWMMGDRYGTVVKQARTGTVSVAMDRSGKTRKLHPERVNIMETAAEIQRLLRK